MEADHAAPVKRDESAYLEYPWFEDRDVDLRCHTVKMATTRKAGTCCGYDGEVHDIPAGTRVYLEECIMDGEWCRSRLCVPCMDRHLDDEEEGYGD